MIKFTESVLQSIVGGIAGNFFSFILAGLWQKLKRVFESWRVKRKKTEVARRKVRAICILLIKRGIAIVLIVILVM